MAELLLARGADPSMRDTRGRFPWQYAHEGGLFDLLKAAIPPAASLGTPAGERGAAAAVSSPAAAATCKKWFDAALSGNVEELTHAYNAPQSPMRDNVDAVDVNGLTALLIACRGGRVNVALQLLGWGADPNGWAPLHTTSVLHEAAYSGVFFVG